VINLLLQGYPGDGANDNFKGVATLYGSGTTSYKRTLLWATVTTFLGSTTALLSRDPRQPPRRPPVVPTSNSRNIKVTNLFIADQRALTTREVSRIGAL
jgi:hypothetical protein